MPTINLLGVAPIQAAHPLAEVPFRGFDQQMVMIAHQTLGITPPLLLLHFLAEQRQESTTVSVIERDSLPPIATSGDMIESPVLLKASWSSYEREATEQEMVSQAMTPKHDPKTLSTSLSM